MFWLKLKNFITNSNAIDSKLSTTSSKIKKINENEEMVKIVKESEVNVYIGKNIFNKAKSLKIAKDLANSASTNIDLSSEENIIELQNELELNHMLVVFSKDKEDNSKLNDCIIDDSTSYMSNKTSENKVNLFVYNSNKVLILEEIPLSNKGYMPLKNITEAKYEKIKNNCIKVNYNDKFKKKIKLIDKIKDQTELNTTDQIKDHFIKDGFYFDNDKSEFFVKDN